eukprot:5512176-Pleurochrysis_carterae.AAC.1
MKSSRATLMLFCGASVQIADRDALFTFHEEYQTSDSVPIMPHTLKTSDGRSREMHGMPIEWSILWSTLSKRFTREHHCDSAEDGTTSADVSCGAASIARNLRLAACSCRAQKTLALCR